MHQLNKKYIPHLSIGVVSILFTISLFVFKPVIKMIELYTLFARVKATSTTMLDFGGENFVISSVVPAIPNVNFLNYPIIFDLFYCFLGVFFITCFIYLIPNLFIGFCFGLSTIISFALYSVVMSHINNSWIPIIWPMLIQIFFLCIFTTLKITIKQTKQISSIKIFGYDINKFPNSFPNIKNIIRQPRKIDTTLCCFRIKIPQIIIERLSDQELVYKINEIFKIITDGCLKYDGIIDKTSNNTILAYWLGDKSAEKALEAALEIQDIINKLSTSIKVSCGISSEKSIFAILGTEYFSNYTLIGNINDIANRIENACVFHNTSILICETTYQQLKEKLVAINKGAITIHGLYSQIEFYEPQYFVLKKEIQEVGNL